MLTDPISYYAATDILYVDPGGSIQDLIDAFYKSRTRHLMVDRIKGEFISIDSIFSLLARIARIVRDPSHLASMKIGSIRTIKPGRINGSRPIIDAIRLMSRTRKDLLLVDLGAETGVVTIRDVIEAIGPGEARTPAIRHATPQYPSVTPRSSLMEVVAKMGTYSVRSVLVVENGTVSGVMPSLAVAEALSRHGFDALWDEVESVARPVEAVVEASSSLGDAARAMAIYDTEIVILGVGKNVVGVIDEWGIVKALAEGGEPLILDR